ncbi:retrovirus-related pol polyprotein from transposon TNT 1-94 [Tanacetum coccineum]
MARKGLHTSVDKNDSEDYDEVGEEEESVTGHSQNSKAYIILNKHTRKVKESFNVIFDETLTPSKTSPLVDDDLDEEEAIKVTEKKNLENNIVDETLEIDEIVNIKESRNHPLENVIGNLNQRTLRLVAQGYNQQEGIDYDETYAPVARLESIRILLAYACALDFKLFQMDVKSAFLNGFINEEVTMPRATGLDHQKTRNYIPLISNEFNQPLLNTMANLEKWYFHEGRVVSPNFENMSHIRAKFESIGFDCLLDINEQIVPRFVLEFYCQLTFTYNPEGQFVVNFVIQNKSFSLTLEEFGQILKIPFKGQASNTEMWSLDHLSVSVPSRGLYKTKPPSPRVIKTLIQVPRQGQETRTKNKKTIVVDFSLSKGMEKTRFKPKELLPYEMLLTRLFKHVMSISPKLAFDHYLSHDRAMHPLAPHYKRKTRADRGIKRPCESNASSSSHSKKKKESSFSSRPFDQMVDENDEESFHLITLLLLNKFSSSYKLF